MKNTLETRLGLFFALAVLAAFLLFEIIGATDLFRSGYVVKTYFNNVHDLKKGDPVKMAGVQIGRVSDIGFDNNRVLVNLRIDGRHTLKTDSRATIKFLGLMGQNYISVTLGTGAAEKMAAGGVLETDEQPDLSALMARMENVAIGVENVTKSFSGDSIQNILGPITDFVKDNSENLTATIANMKALSDGITRGEGTVGKLLKDDQLYYTTLGTVKKLEGTADTLNSTLGDARGLFTDARGSLNNVSNVVNKAGAALDTAQETLTETRSAVADMRAGKGSLGKIMTDDTFYVEATASMTNLREILQKINQGQGSVGKFVNDESLFRNIKMTLQKFEKATEGLEDTGPLSILGTAVSSLF
jgi:phospholipid/cholesterol/gamma-HCH transport system substrate-binding protein